MENLKNLAFIAALLLLAIAVVWYLQSSPVLTQIYSSSTKTFVLRYQAGDTAHAGTNEDGSQFFTFENSSDDGVQLTVTSFDENMPVLTAKRIETDIPDVLIADARSVSIATSTGLEFTSNNPAFDGSSEELWFVHGGYLYQFSTYAHDKRLLDAMFRTFKFSN